MLDLKRKRKKQENNARKQIILEKVGFDSLFFIFLFPKIPLSILIINLNNNLIFSFLLRF